MSVQHRSGDPLCACDVCLPGLDAKIRTQHVLCRRCGHARRDHADHPPHACLEMGPVDGSFWCLCKRFAPRQEVPYWARLATRLAGWCLLAALTPAAYGAATILARNPRVLHDLDAGSFLLLLLAGYAWLLWCLVRR